MTEQRQNREDRLDALREEAARSGKVHDRGVRPLASPFPTPASTGGPGFAVSPPLSYGAESYRGNPVLKPPTWTWQVPLYFFAGGVAGASATIALVSHFAGNVGLMRAALWIAFAGALISPPLLIADLGRPALFLNMLRVFKLRSAMSIGAWTLVAFSSATGLALVCSELILAGYGNSFLLGLEWVAEILAALSGLVLASYTSVLLGVTAVPVWSENRTLLPPVFLAGGLGSAAAVLELLGFLVSPTQFLGVAASSVETIAAILIESRRRYVDRPLREGVSGWVTRVGSALAGPVSLLLRIFWGHNLGPRYVAALCFIVGALIGRYAWIAAGRISARDPQALFQIQRLNRQQAVQGPIEETISDSRRAA